MHQALLLISFTQALAAAAMIFMGHGGSSSWFGILVFVAALELFLWLSIRQVR